MDNDEIRNIGTISSFIVNRLLRTGLITPADEPTQKNFDYAYEADIEAIVKRVLQDKKYSLEGSDGNDSIS